MKEFAQVIGHDDVIEHLQKGIRENKVSHAYILSGERDPVRDCLPIFLHLPCNAKKAAWSLAENANHACR